MANRQLKILRDDFLKYYNKTSLVMRIFIGAALSFGIAYYAIKKQIKPQQAEIKKIQDNLSKMMIVNDVDLMMADLKNRQRKLEKSLKFYRNANDRLAEQKGQLKRSESGKIVLEIRSLLDQNAIRILAEKRVGAKVNKKLRRRKRSRSATDNDKEKKIKLSLPQSIDDDIHHFTVLGSYNHIKNFLMKAFRRESTFFINNISLERSNEIFTDRDFKQHKVLQCDFELHIPYRKEGKQK